MTWTNSELSDHLSEYFKFMNGRILITSSGINKLLKDPRCPDPEQSNLVQFLIKIGRQFEKRPKNGV